MSLHLPSQLFPVVAICVRLLAPQIKLELTLRKRAPFEAFVWTLLSGDFHGRLHSSMVDCLEDLRVEIKCFRALESKTHLLTTFLERQTATTYQVRPPTVSRSVASMTI